MLKKISNYSDFDDLFFPLLNSDNTYTQTSIKYDHGTIEPSGDYFIDVMLPGFKKENIKLDYDNKSIIVKAERTEDDNISYALKNSGFGKISERWKISFEPKEINATYENGVLRILMKRKKEDIPKINF